VKGEEENSERLTDLGQDKKALPAPATMIQVHQQRAGFARLSIHKWPICLITALCSKFYPRNINYMPAVKPELKLVACLDLNPICLFLDEHYLHNFRLTCRH
jgi:hypothetical protein